MSRPVSPFIDIFGHSGDRGAVHGSRRAGHSLRTGIPHNSFRQSAMTNETKALTVAFVCALVYEFPPLLGLLQEHLDDQEGEVLPHLFMADLERWIEAELACRGGQSRELVVRILKFLETAVHRNHEIAELIHASFLEHLPRPGQPGAEIRTRLGPVLTERLRQIG
jgi:hypothetical protein